MVDMSHMFYLVMLEQDQISYDEYVRQVPAFSIPPEYATVALFMKNKGKVGERIQREGEKMQADLQKGIIPDHWQ